MVFAGNLTLWRSLPLLRWKKHILSFLCSGYIRIFICVFFSSNLSQTHTHTLRTRLLMRDFHSTEATCFPTLSQPSCVASLNLVNTQKHGCFFPFIKWRTTLFDEIDKKDNIQTEPVTMQGNRAFFLARVYIKWSCWEFNLNNVVVKLFQMTIWRPVNSSVATEKGRNMKTVDGVAVRFMVRIG